jgi:hypothetical protein
MKIGLKIPSNVTNRTVGAGICLVSIGIYNILFFNKYLPLSEGWFSVYAHYIQSGAMPYRDFHFFLPPVYPYIISIFTNIFGDGFIGLRILGIVVILCITLLLFLLYSRLFPTYIACVAAIVSVIYWQSNVAFIGYNFISFLHLFALLGIYFICKYYDYDDHSLKSGEGRKAMAFLFCAGLLGAMAFLTKQSDGFFVFIFSFLAVAISVYSKEGFRNGFRSVVIYSVGAVIPILVLLSWLISNGILLSFWNQVFIGASYSKGGLIAILFSWIPRLFTLENVGGLIAATLIIIALRIYCFPQGFSLGKLGGKNNRANNPTTSKMVVIYSFILVLLILCILLPFWNIGLSYNLNENHFLNFVYYRVLIITGFTGSLLLFCIYLLKIFRERKALYFDIFIISTMSLGFLWSTSTSAAIGDMGMILALGLLLGYLSFIPSYFHVSKIATLILCAFLILFLTSSKYIHPYTWWGLTQPDIRTASTPLNVKSIDGLVVSENTSRIYSEVTSSIEKYTKPGDNIYTFPNIPIFYLLTDCYPNTFALVSWFDVLPDQLAEDDAHRLIESPPKIIIYLDVPEYVWQAHEEMFRSGQMSGQRMIKEAIEGLTSSGSYEREAEFDVPDSYTLTVWRMLPGFESHTKLLLHADGMESSTVFTDEMGKNITAVGHTHIDTSEKKFGTASASFDGTGDYLTVTNSVDFDFGSEDFTIDGWFYFNVNDIGYQILVDRRSNSDGTGWLLYLETNNAISFLSASASGWDNFVISNTEVAPARGVWTHLAVVRNGDVFTIYQNGIALKSGIFTGSIGAQTVNPTIGAGHTNPVAGFNGYIDELRISKGIAKWTEDFTPLAAPYMEINREYSPDESTSDNEQ